MAGGVLDSNQVGVREDLENAVYNAEAAETPFLSMLGKPGKLVNSLFDFQMKGYPRRGFGGVVDGQDVSEFKHNPRVRAQGRTMIFREPWKVSTVAAEQDVAGVPDEVAEQKADAIIIMKQGIERMLLSNVDSREDDGATVSGRTRGALQWLLDSAQSELPVPAAYRPSTAQRFTGGIATLTETAFLALMQSTYEQRRKQCVLDGFVGTDVKAQTDNYTFFQNDVASTTPVRQYNDTVSDKTFLHCVDFIKSSFGTVRLHLNAYLACDVATGLDTAYTPKSGIFIDLDMWKLRKLADMKMVELEDEGGGRRGYVQAILGLQCNNPLGQFSVYTNS